MSARRPPLLLLAVLAALAVGLWVATRAVTQREHASLRPSGSTQPSTEPAGRADLAELPAAAKAAEPAAELPAAALPARTAVSTAYEEELARGLFVEGRVVLPPGTPADERVQVVAKGKKFKHGPPHAVDVGPDGRFRATFAEGTKYAHLELDARYLYLSEPVKVAPGAAEPVVLEPLLGGVLTGRVLPPPDEPGAAQALLGRRVELVGWQPREGGGFTSAFNRSVELDGSLAFEFRGLAAEVRHDLRCDPLIYEPGSVEDLYVPAGAATVMDLEVRRGVELAGRVVDETGAPLSSVEVEATAEVQDGSTTHYRRRSAKTEPDGAFSLAGLSPGAVTLSVEVPGYERLEHRLGRFERGARRDGVELKLGRGGSIAGRVLWPDGSPAEGASVTAVVSTGPGGRSSAVKTDAAGAFALTGLEPGGQRISASAVKKETVLVASELLGKEVEKTVRRTLRATLDDVQAGASGLVLQLTDGLSVSGAVVDDLGVPVQSFRVSYGLIVDEVNYVHTRDDKLRMGKDGAFSLEGLDNGTYQLEVTAKGHLPAAGVRVEVPAAAPLAPIRLVRAARVAGVVLTPDGEPAPHATVETTQKTGGQTFFPGGWVQDEGFEFSALTDEEGRFSAETGVGAIEVRARLAGYSSSKPVALVLAPGALEESASLRLERGATLTGSVVDGDGKGVPGRRVEISLSTMAQFEAFARTDDAGRFAFSGLETGPYSVVAPPSEAELAALGLSTADGASNLLARKAEVQLTAQGADVVLAATGVSPVRVFGTITVGGKPAAARLWIQYEEGQGESTSAQADASGAYEVLLAPATCWISIHLGASQASVRMLAVISGPGEQRLDIDVPVGSLSGRVLGPSGPVEGIAVNLHLQRRADGLQGSGYASAQTDASGRYAVEELPAGTWSVEAGGNRGESGASSSTSRLYTQAKVEDVAVASGQRVRDVDLHVGWGGIITGSVLTAAGEPAKGAIVNLRLPSGAYSEPYSFALADAQGAFTLAGLVPRDYVLGAVLGTDQCTELAVTLEEAGERPVELRLAPGTLLRVALRDAAGAPVKAQLACLRADGKDYSSWFTWSFSSAPPPDEQRLGPLPPGTYAVTATREGAAPVAKTVTLAGEPELLVELIF